MRSPRKPETPASERYERLRKLGEGATGDVFLVRERETGELFALKQLRHMDPKGVLRLKREFRALADLDHPNLVKLYDLVNDGEGFVLLMEYIDGVDLKAHLASLDGSLVETFHELAVGVAALHNAGILHRDLKPSNVLVSSSRVVLLDFGLVRALHDQSQYVTLDGTVAGTPAYMAPEQATSASLTEACDWYALGVMLYEALAGSLPIEGRNAASLVQRKLNSDPTPLPADPTIPEALRELCMQLLARSPTQRPRGQEVVLRLAALSHGAHNTNAVRSGMSEPVQAPENDRIIGREPELAQLQAAREQAEHEAVVVHLRGSSGSGKSALIEQYLLEQKAARDRDCLVLRSRCYERESMPFKALDGIVDALVRHLATLDDVEAAHLAPSDVADLTQLFPMFERVQAFRHIIATRKLRRDAAQVRQRAENALRELMSHVGRRRLPMVIVDDLHWGDLDSARVLSDWVVQPFTPLLLILSYRGEEAATSSCLRVILESTRPLPPTAAREIEIELQPLSDSQIEELCRARRDSQQAISDQVVTRIVHESQGNPFLAQQLTALAQARQSQGDDASSTLSLGGLVTQAGEILPTSARALLDVIAVAGRPLSPALAFAVAGISNDGRGQIHRLQRLRLLRMREVAGERKLEVYHDRVREAVGAALSSTRRAQIHQALLHALEQQGSSDTDWLHVLALGAGDRTAALRYGERAIEQALATLAFERAAELCRTCLSICDDPIKTGELWTQLGHALARSRHGVKAAQAYVRAAEYLQDRATPLFRLAASHFLRSGRFEEGDALVRKVLHAHNVHVPSSERGLMAAIAVEMARQAVRGDGLSTRTGPESEKAAEVALLYGTLASETVSDSPVRAVLFMLRALRYAQDSGDAVILARALLLKATMTCISGTARAARRTEALLARADALLKQQPERNLLCELEVYSTRSICAMLFGRPHEVLETAYRAGALYEEKLESEEHGEYYYMFAVHAARLGALANLARYKDIARELTEVLALARASDNRTAFLMLTMPVTMAEQMANCCAHTLKRLQAERKQLPTGNFAIMHLQHLLASMRAACASGDHAAYLPNIEHDWPLYLRSHVYRGAYMAYVAHTTHARLLLNRYVETGQGDPARLIRDDLRAIERLPPSGFVTATGCRHRARLANFAGDKQRAIELLRESMAAFDAIEFRDESAVERYAVGALLGGSEGTQLMATSLAILEDIGCADPLANVRAYYPELTPAKLPR